MIKRKDGVFSLLRHIIGNQKKIIKEQEKQTKMLQAIESNKEQYESIQIFISKKVDKEHIVEQINSSLEDYRIDGKKFMSTVIV